uniref:Portal n=1 Tax=Myoviridae sp. ctwVB15 TaxID=2825208 RepID=A0A8S5UND7_9CAUD|nr:MAG TPA: Portal [Myoviridae sp. ctwVB15]
MKIFKRKKKEEKKPFVSWESVLMNDEAVSFDDAERFLAGVFKTPETNATIRLQGNADDYGMTTVRAYNDKQVVKNEAWGAFAVSAITSRARSSNQWINVPQSVNAGFSTAQLSYYLFQSVNYYDCMLQAQDPLMAKVLTILSETPFSKGGKIANKDKDEADKILDAAEKKKLTRKFVKAIRSMYAVGGCLLYLQTNDADLTEPLDLKSRNMNDITDFVHIDPINVTAISVNTSEPAKSDYMNPSVWYVVGLGAVHASRFLKFEANVPELLLKPLCMYFGTPLTNLIKQDIANSNLATQGLANLINRCRFLFLKTDDNSYQTGAIRDFRARLEVMSKMQDNHMFTPLKTTEDVLQQTTALTGFSETTEFLYEVVAAKTGIPLTELLGTTAKGMNATGEGDRRSWYDRVNSIRESVREQWETVLGIIAGQISDGAFQEIHYVFNLLETPTEAERAEINKANLEVAKALIEVGGNAENVFDWLRKDDNLQIDSVEFDAERFDESDFDAEMQPNGELTADAMGQIPSETATEGLKSQNIWIDNPDTFITMKKSKVPLKDGETKKEAVERFLSDKGRLKKTDKAPQEREAESDVKTKEKKDNPLSYENLIKGFDPSAYPDSWSDEEKRISYVDKRREEVRAQKDVEETQKRAGDYTVERTTAKAALLRKGDKTFWVQKRWLREDGTLTAAGQKAYEEAETDSEKQARQEKKKADRERGVERPAKADWESDKAYGYDLDLDFYNVEKNRRHRIFIPKSVIQPNGNIPTWILEKKIEEIKDKYAGMGGFYIDKHPFKGHSFGFIDLSHNDEEDANSENEKMKSSNSANDPIYSIDNYVLRVSTDNGETWADVGNDE